MLKALLNRKKILYIVCLFFCGSCTSAEPKVSIDKDSVQSSIFSLQERTILSGKMGISLPTSFQPMNEGLLAIKYPVDGRRPTEVYSNENGSVNVAFNHTQNRVTVEELPQIKTVLEQQFNNPQVELLGSEVKEINGREYILLEMITPAADARIYNLMFVTSLEERLFIGTFNCTEALRERWELVGREIVNSIK